YHRVGHDVMTSSASLPDYSSAISYTIKLLKDREKGVVRELSDIDAVGFKPVHAMSVTGCKALTDDVLDAMHTAIPLAPAHNPPYLAAIQLFRELMPEIPLYGLFEPTFHETIPEFARVYGVPQEWESRYGIRRYGFHGASHRYIAERVPQLIGPDSDAEKIVSCHLGGSSSVCAIDGGKSVDTSMGLTPQSGLMQSNRIGDLDPFAVLSVMDQSALTTDEIRGILCSQSGLKGVSGLESGDMRDLLEAEHGGHERASLAVKAFVYEIKKLIGAYAAAMGGLSAVAFTGGIGERSTLIRERVCTGLEFLGVEIDDDRNRSCENEGIISSHENPVAVAVIPAREEFVIAREVSSTLKLTKGDT
ncbi:MAG: acetate/propionate family kinase, partial [Candidatus Latescibacteria bacterium]|nr:acetate/propionate family kinase [Candidatus Latescibacterota bacterium]